MNTDKNQATVLELSSSEKLLVWVVPSLLGLVLGWFIPAIAQWAAALPWVPFEGIIKLIASLHGPWVIIATTCLGLIAGLCLTHVAFKESLVARLTDQSVHFKINNEETILSKEKFPLPF
ncbi:hypothetical protein [Bacillus sp. FJAT-26390]|uniref:YqeB family protein n=1 Tax=Bacillus sp. FJAT-26390 TaxID=1743142 RepID=UPI00210039D5|nr:hypothetical protein [Bacillus sp. FJAT-26390]